MESKDGYTVIKDGEKKERDGNRGFILEDGKVDGSYGNYSETRLSSSQIQNLLQWETLFRRILTEEGQEFSTKDIGSWDEYEKSFIHTMSSEDLIQKTGRIVGRKTNVWRIRKSVIDYIRQKE